MLLIRPGWLSMLAGLALLSLPGCSLPRAAVAKHRILGAPEQQEHIPLRSGAQKSDAVSPGQVPGEAGQRPSGAVRETPRRLFPHSWLLACFHLQRRPLWSACLHPLICPRPVALGRPPATASSRNTPELHRSLGQAWIAGSCGVQEPLKDTPWHHEALGKLSSPGVRIPSLHAALP